MTDAVAARVLLQQPPVWPQPTFCAVCAECPEEGGLAKASLPRQGLAWQRPHTHLVCFHP